jgi:hypothetical protein
MQNPFKGKYSPVALTEGTIWFAIATLALISSAILWLCNLLHLL